MSIMNTGGGVRGMGVGIPEDQRRPQEQGNPGEIVNFVEAKTYAVQHYNNDGRLITTMYHRIGGVWHQAPNGENYAATLRPIAQNSKLGKGLEERFLGENTKSVPKEDAVDVLADPKAKK